MEKYELEELIDKKAGEAADGFRAGFIWMAFWPILLPILATLYILGLIATIFEKK